MKLSLPALSLVILGNSVGALAAATTVFSNDFEDGDTNPEIGSWTLGSTGSYSVPAVTGGADATLGEDVFFADNNGTGSLSMTLDFADLSLSGGDSATISFDFFARRTNGFAKTVYIEGLNSLGIPVFQFVLGDSGAFGNSGGDRQRPGFGTSSGTSTLPAPSVPGSFWFGADTNPSNGADPLRDASFNLTVHSDGWDLTTVSQAGVSYSTLDLPTFDGTTFDDLASIEITSAGTGFGGYWDNLTVSGEVIPEPSSSALLLLSGLSLLGLRRRSS